MKIEILFPSFANLYGEKVALRYLAKCLPEAEFIETELNDEPEFVKNDVNMIYMGPMTESQQELVTNKLAPHKERIEELIAGGTVFLILGNALEVFGEYIENEDGSRIDGLGIFATHAKRRMFRRYNSLILGDMDGIKIVGFKAQFAHSYGDNENEYLYKVVRGDGLNPDTRLEGLRRNNFMATYTLGPMLLLNPDFTVYLMKLLGARSDALPFEKEIREAYAQRLKEFENPSTVY